MNAPRRQAAARLVDERRAILRELEEAKTIYLAADAREPVVAGAWSTLAREAGP